MRFFTLTIALFFCMVLTALAQDQVYAYEDFISTKENVEVKLPVLNNDIGLDRGVSKLVITEEPGNGQAIIQEDNQILYIPDYSFEGEDVFTYEVCNVDGSCDKADVYVKVQDVDYKPKAVNDTLTYYHGSSEEYDFIENDIIEGDGPVTVTFLNDLARGEYELTAENKLVLSFDRRFIGKDSLKYTICDINNDCSEAYVFIEVQRGESIGFFIPQGFSPNGDDINDTFYVPDFSAYEQMSLSVIDSWGSLVFQSENYSNDWNGVGNKGRNNGRVVPAGTYYYCFKIQGISKRVTGYVYITN